MLNRFSVIHYFFSFTFRLPVSLSKLGVASVAVNLSQVGVASVAIILRHVLVSSMDGGMGSVSVREKKVWLLYLSVAFKRFSSVLTCLSVYYLIMSEISCHKQHTSLRRLSATTPLRCSHCDSAPALRTERNQPSGNEIAHPRHRCIVGRYPGKVQGWSMKSHPVLGR